MLLVLLSCAPAPHESVWLDEVSAGILASPFAPVAEGERFRLQREDLSLSIGVDGATFGGVHLGLNAVGTSVGPGECATDGTKDPRGQCLRRIEIDHDDLVEWFQSTPRALEHGFTVLRGDEDLVVDVAVAGAIVEVIEDDLALLIAPDRTYRYEGLVAWDAEGHDLPARMEAGPHGIRLRVDARGATFPIEIDPEITAEWVVEGTRSGEDFGWSVAAAGDVNGDGYDDVIIGAPDGGSAAYGGVYVYHGSASGLSTTASWSAEPSNNATSFGYAVSTAGDVNRDGYDDILIGDPAGGTSSEGRVYAVSGSASGLSTTSAWVYESNQASAGLGNAVGGGGDVNNDGYDDIVAGATGIDNGSTDEGSIVLFTGSASGLGSSPNWSEESDQTSAQLGYSVAIVPDLDGDGYDEVAATSLYYDNGQTDEGQVFLWLGSSTGPASTADWTSDSDQTSGYCGNSVAGVGDLNGDGYGELAWTCVSYDDGSSNDGVVWLYYGAETGLASTADWSWTVENGQDQVGQDVAAAGDLNGDGFGDLAIGTASATNTRSAEGAVRVFYGADTGIGADADWEAFADSTYAYLGYSLDGAGDVNGDGFDDLLAGAYSWYDNGTSEGRAFLWTGSATGLGAPAATDYQAFDAQVTTSAHLGYAVASGGDFDNDGYGDILAGAPGYSPYGEAIAFYGSASGIDTDAYSVIAGTSTSERFGAATAIADVNADGYDDAIVGAPDYSSYTGRTFIYHGSATGLGTSATRTLTGGQSGAYFGSAVCAAGDVNNDGYDDIAVASYQYDDPATAAGAVFMYHGSASGIGTTATTTLTLGQDSSWFGAAVAGNGDVNGDGYDDLLVSATQWDDGENEEGMAFLFLGSATGLATTAYWQVGSDQSGAYGASSLALVDVNGDTFADIVVGSHLYNGAATDSGMVSVYLGGATGPSTTADWTADGVESGAYFGRSVANAGDTDGDTVADLLIGAYGDNGTVTDEGMVTLWLGGSSGLGSEADTTMRPGDGPWNFGFAVSGGSDVEADGYADIVVGAYLYDAGYTTDSGQIRVYPGAPVDSDADGHIHGTDCDDHDATAYPGAAELCDGADNDCDGLTDEEVPTWYRDADSDTFGGTTSISSCTAPSGYVADGTDCDDTNAAVNPNATEICDGGDNDCDGEVDPSTATDATAWYDDADGDGYGAGTATVSCIAPTGWVAVARDCDDTDGAIYPGAVEACDGIDNDCDGGTDETPPTWYADTDGDGYGNASVSTDACTAPSNYVATAGDCDDSTGAVNPAALEVCDGIDNDCDGSDDESGASGETTWYRDSDSDGYGNAAVSVSSCTAPSGYIADDTDCDDTRSTVSPADTETCNGRDDNCDGSTDESGTDAATWYVDSDSDGYGGTSTVVQCSAPSGYVATAGDCNDSNAGVNPSEVEVCDGVDQDCDGTVDDGVSTVSYRDADGDGYGDASSPMAGCGTSSGYVSNDEDCDDTDATVTLGDLWYEDADGDGYGNATETLQACDLPDGYSENDDDCDDTNLDAYPGATERWYDGVDQACDGGNDNDQDGDGHESASRGGDDCNDSDATVYPGAPDEPYDGVISDCDGADENDADGDGYDAVNTGGDDCDDADANANPGGTEIWYDGIDQDCDGNDDDQDGDGLVGADDCDDTDANVGACDTTDTSDTLPDDTGPAAEDTGSDDGKDGGCGCGTANMPAFGALIGALFLVRRRTGAVLGG